MKELLDLLGRTVSELLPSEDAIALNRRQADCLAEATDALAETEESTDLVIIADSLRRARLSFDRLTGQAGVEAVLDALFSRFCLGK